MNTLILAVALSASVSLAATAAPVRMLTPDDLYRVQDVSDAEVSPDGAWVAYVVTSNDRESDEAHSAIWMVSWDGRQQLPLTPASDGPGKPRWSPDGRYLAYLVTPAASDRTQLMLLDRRGGAAQPLGKVVGEISDYVWSPDSKRLLLVMQLAVENAAIKPIVIDALRFKVDEDGYVAQGDTRHLVLRDVDTGMDADLTSDPKFNEESPAWAPDGRTIAFVRTHGKGADPDGREEIDIIEPRAGATLRPIARPFAPNSQKLVWSTDSGSVVYLQGIEPKYNAYIQDRLAVVTPGTAPRALSDLLDRAVVSFALDSAASVLLAVEDDRSVYPARLNLTSGRVSRVGPDGKFVVSSLSSAAGHTALIETSDAALAEVHALEAGNSAN